MEGLAAPQGQAPVATDRQPVDGAPPSKEAGKGPVVPAKGPTDERIGASLQSEAADPEHQKMYEALAKPMIGMIHSPEAATKIQDQLRSGKTIGEVTFEIANAVITQIEGQGKEVPLGPLQDAAEDVVEDLVEISVVMKLIPDEEEAIEQAYMEGLTEAIEMYGIQSRKNGRLSPEQSEEMLADGIKLGGFNKSKMSAAIEQGLANGQ